MSQRQWIAVDEYFTGALIDIDDALHAALTASDAAGLPAIAVSPAQGKLLNLLATLMNARRILEVRDQQCTDLFCEEPPNRCQGDHIIPYTAGGLTSQDNGKLACGPHNRRNYRNYRLRPPDEDCDSDEYDDDD